MTPADAEQFVQRYEKSWFNDRDAGNWFEDPGNIHLRVSGGEKVPRLAGRELVQAMIRNVEESRRDVEGTAERMRRARQDGLVDRDAFLSLPKDAKELRARWRAAAEGIKADYARAVAELRHWQEYATWASEQARATEPAAPDPRLPPERDDADERVPF